MTAAKHTPTPDTASPSPPNTNALPPLVSPLPTEIDLFDVALDGASKALPVFRTMLKKLDWKGAAMVADEIDGNVQTAFKVYRERRESIARACNSHDALVAALVEYDAAFTEFDPDSKESRHRMRMATIGARAALNAAKAAP